MQLARKHIFNHMALTSTAFDVRWPLGQKRQVTNDLSVIVWSWVIGIDNYRIMNHCHTGLLDSWLIPYSMPLLMLKVIKHRMTVSFSGATL